MTIIIILVGLYSFFILVFILGFHKVKKNELPEKYQRSTPFSIIVPFRNEAKSLPALLESINALNYSNSLCEFIFVDDYSKDEGATIISSFASTSKFRIHLIKSNRKTASPKKDAISTAIKKSKYQWIITIDADCTFNEMWLNCYDYYIQNNNVDFLASSVSFSGKDTFLNSFQILENMSLHTVTLGGFGIEKPMMCNGANMTYKKEVFIALNGFTGNDHIASGDDIFLMQKAINSSYTVKFLKSPDAVVTTQTESSISQLISQRKRWTSKTSVYKNWFTTCIALNTLLGNLSILACFLMLFMSTTNLVLCTSVIVLKFLVDSLCIITTANYFKQYKPLKHLLLSLFIYPVWTVYIALISVNKSYTWKGRLLR